MGEFRKELSFLYGENGKIKLTNENDYHIMEKTGMMPAASPTK